MLIYWRTALLGMIGSLLFVSLRALLEAAVLRSRSRHRLTYFRKAMDRRRLSRRPGKLQIWSAHLEQVMESVGIRWPPSFFLGMTAFLGSCGAASGIWFFQSAKGVLVAFLMLSSAPYILLRMRLISLQMKARIDFLPAVETFYQTYVMAGHRNMRMILQACVSDGRLDQPMKGIFEQLQRNLLIGADTDRTLDIFKLSLGHHWGAYFTELIKTGLTDGLDVSGGLKELIRDMRKAQLADQSARNRLLEIRIANFAPVLFLLAFLAVNFHFDYAHAVYYYLAEPSGRDMLLNGVLLIFVSFLMGIYLSMKRL